MLYRLGFGLLTVMGAALLALAYMRAPRMQIIDAQTGPSLDISLSPGSSVVEGNRIWAIFSFNDLTQGTSVNYGYRADITNLSTNGDADNCEGDNIGSDETIADVDSSTEIEVGTITASCPVGSYRLNLSLKDSANVELDTASIDFAIVPPPTATPTPTPTNTPTLGEYSGWRGKYFDNPDLAGNPVLTRDDANLDFNWRRESPGTGVPVDDFSVRWERIVTFADSRIYRFNLIKNDGARVWFDDRLIFDLWNDDDDGRTYFVELHVTAGAHSFRVEYREDDLDARVRFWWDRKGSIPTSTPTPTATATAQPPLEEFSGWRGEYYNHLHLGGEPVLVRDDAEIDFDWGRNSPADVVRADNFSVRWERIVSFDEGLYRFTARRDNVVRIFIDDRPIPLTHDSATNTHNSDVQVLAGDRRVRVEFEEHEHNALIEVSWVKLNPTPTPTHTPTPTPTSTRTLEEHTNWRVEGYANQDLAGAPFRVWSQDHLDVNYRGNGTHGLPRDRFSLRWERIITFDGGLYRFFVHKNDGARVWVDGQLIIDHWKDCCDEGHQFHADLPLIAGDHTVRVEYYEKEGDAWVRLWWERKPLPALTPTPERPSLWSATMTVGSGGGLRGYGADTGGTLSDNDFTLHGRNYTVDAVLHNPFASSVSIDFSDDIDTGSQELTLCLGALRLDFADAFGPDARQFFWDNVDPGWSDGGSVSVGLNGCQ